MFENPLRILLAQYTCIALKREGSFCGSVQATAANKRMRQAMFIQRLKHQIKARFLRPFIAAGNISGRTDMEKLFRFDVIAAVWQIIENI
jgi:hypothetical protein